MKEIYLNLDYTPHGTMKSDPVNQVHLGFLINQTIFSVKPDASARTTPNQRRDENPGFIAVISSPYDHCHRPSLDEHRVHQILGKPRQHPASPVQRFYLDEPGWTIHAYNFSRSRNYYKLRVYLLVL